MHLKINGETRNFEAQALSTVSDLMSALDIDDARGVAVAVNDEVVPKRRWDESTLQPGDRVEIIRATQGG